MKARKILAMVMALALTAALAVGGTLAYLTSQDTVTNTFTVGNVSITMDEAKINTDGKPVDADDKEVTDLKQAKRVESNEYHLLPGHTYTKDPTIRVGEKSEDCYVFIKVQNDLVNMIDGTTIEAQISNQWKEVETTTTGEKIYIYAIGDQKKTKVSANDALTPFTGFTIKGDADINTLTDTDGDGVIDAKIVVTAYAVQADGFDSKTPAEIWTAAKFN